MSRNPLIFFWADLRRRLPYRRYSDLSDRPRRLRAQAFSLLALVLGLAYLLWAGRLVWRTPGWQDLLFLAAEVLSFLLLALLAFGAWHRRAHRPEGLEPLAGRTVDIFIPCCGEPLPVIRTTLEAVARLRHCPMTV